MKHLILTLLLSLTTVAAWQFVQRRSLDRELDLLQAQLDPSVSETNSTTLPVRTRSLKPSARPESDAQGVRKLALLESMGRFGQALASGKRRLMELRDQLPEDERVPFDDIVQVAGSVSELKITDASLATALIQEADIVMRSMIDTMTSMDPKEAIKLTSGESNPNQNHFGLGYLASALDLSETEREHLAAALAQSENPDEVLKSHLTEEHYRFLIELTQGKRFHELSEEERNEPLDLLGEVESLF